MESIDKDTARRLLTDPATTEQDLARILARYPDLADRVAAHRAADSIVLEWLGVVPQAPSNGSGDPLEADDARQAAPPSAGHPSTGRPDGEAGAEPRRLRAGELPGRSLPVPMSGTPAGGRTRASEAPSLDTSRVSGQVGAAQGAPVASRTGHEPSGAAGVGSVPTGATRPGGTSSASVRAGRTPSGPARVGAPSPGSAGPSPPKGRSDPRGRGNRVGQGIAVMTVVVAVLFFVLGLLRAPGGEQSTGEGPMMIADLFPDPALADCVSRSTGYPLDALVGPTDLLDFDWTDRNTVLSCVDVGIGNLQGLELLADLEWLDLRGNRIVDVQPVGGLTSLRILDLGGNPVSDVGPLGGLTALESLDLADCPVADVQPLADLRRLRSLTLSGTPVEDLSPLDGLVEDGLAVYRD